MNKKDYVEKGSVLGALKNNYILLLIVSGGLVLRIYDLGTESIWFDELLTIEVSKLGFRDQIQWFFNRSHEGNPPFYYMFLHLWIPLFGDSEFISRLPSAIFGALSIVAIYTVGKLLFNKTAGLIASLILATSVFHIRYSQEARSYSFMVLLALISIYSFLKLMSNRKRAYSFVYIVSNIFLVLTHYYGLLIILAQNVFYFTLFLKNRKVGELGVGRWIKLQLILGLLFLPGFFLFAKILLAIIQTGVWVSWIPEPKPDWFLGYLTIYSGSLYLTIMFVIFSFLSVLCFRKINREWDVKQFFQPLNDYQGNLRITSGSVIYLLLLWLSIPIVVPLAVSHIMSPVLVFRYTIAASPAFYLLASKGISNTNNKWFILFISATIAILSLVNVGKYYARVDKYEWREVVSDIEANAGYGDVIVVYPPYEKGSVFYYAERKDLKIIPMRSKFPYFKGLGNRNIWFIVHAHPVNRRIIKSGVKERYDLISEMYYHRLDLFRLREKRKK